MFSNPIAGATNSTYSPSTGGLYTLSITNTTTGCNYTTSVLNVVLASIYNPIAGGIIISNDNSLLTISFSQTISEEQYEISIMDVNGKTILYSKEQMGGINNSTRIVIENLSSGCYIVKLESATKKLSKRIIKI
ncbi:MAG: T9SS type A sorting domain-containing protein [Bacteroidetes bacterium]|nr:T9SS type A sorting domain-containing protein [Bacteroidota bacterium]